MCNRKTNDDFEFNYGAEGLEKMIESAKENDLGSVWERMIVNAIKATPLPNTPLLIDSLKEEFGIPESIANDTIQDTMERTQLLFKLNGENQLVRDCAVHGLTDRARISGAALQKVEKTDFCNIVNTCCKVFSDKTLILTRHGKITAIHSGDEKDYSVLPISELLGELVAHMDAKYPGYKFAGGSESHNLTIAAFGMPNQAKAMLKEYFDAVEAHGGSPNSDFIPGVVFASSDTGVSGANLHAVIGNGRYSGRSIRIGTALKLEHRSGATVGDFKENLGMLFAKFVEQTQVLSRLLDVELLYPEAAMSRIAKKLSLPSKQSSQAIADYIDAFGPGVANAHDLYFALYETVFLAKSEGITGSKLFQIEESATRAMLLDWESYDYPETNSGSATLTTVTATITAAVVTAAPTKATHVA